jgi:uncharacterized protein YbjT (DUF2867 family)
VPSVGPEAAAGGRGGAAGVRSVLLVGATGLVGGECLRLLAGDPAFDRVVVLARRAAPPDSPSGAAGAAGAGGVDWHVVDFERLDHHADLFAVDAVICALGTTIRQAGSRERFRRVDHDYPVAVARLARERGARHFLLVSSVGADAGSRVFYSRVKGEVEASVSGLGYPSLTIVRPSLLLGDRPGFRLGERVAGKLSFLAPRKYRPVEASAVAATLVGAAREDRAGRRVIESREMG